MTSQLRRDIRRLKIWSVGSTCLLVLGAVTVFTQGQAGGTRFQEISVERINIIEQDGRVKLVLANGARQADAVIDGRVIVPGRTRPAGLMFFNDEGDEVGGLIFSGRTQDGQPRATGSLTFDQWKQDQTVALQYVDQNGQRRAGLSVIDRPNTSLAVFAGMAEKRLALSTDAERAVFDREVAALRAQNAPRLFAGKDTGGNATVVLSDPQGRQRLVMTVDPAGRPSIRFLDESGRTVREIVP